LDSSIINAYSYKTQHFWNSIDVFKDVVSGTHTYIVISVSQTPGPSSVQDVNKNPIAMPCDLWAWWSGS